MQRLKSSITGRRGEGWKVGKGEGGRGKGEGGRGKGKKEKGVGRGGRGGPHSNDSSICEHNLKCTQFDAQHCLTHIFTEVLIDYQ